MLQVNGIIYAVKVFIHLTNNKGMSEILSTVILAILQGITEFLPISSSGHLVLARELFGVKDPGLAVDIVLHLGTLVSIVVIFYKQWLGIIKAWIAKPFKKLDSEEQKSFKLGLYVLIGTIPTVIAGLLFMDDLEGSFFRSGKVVSVFMFSVGIWFVITEILFKRKKTLDTKEAGLLNAIVVGIFQAISLISGISRSGMTISGGMHSGLSREKSAKFSFMLATPAILAAGILGVKDLIETGANGSSVWVLIVGFVCAAIVGFVCASWLLKYLKTKNLYVFAIYLIIVGALGFLLI